MISLLTVFSFCISDRPGKFHRNDYKNSGDKHSDEHMKDSNLQVESCNESNSLSGQPGDVAVNHEPKKRHKLHWGYVFSTTCRCNNWTLVPYL